MWWNAPPPSPLPHVLFICWRREPALIKCVPSFTGSLRHPQLVALRSPLFFLEGEIPQDQGVVYDWRGGGLKTASTWDLFKTTFQPPVSAFLMQGWNALLATLWSEKTLPSVPHLTVWKELCSDHLYEISPDIQHAATFLILVFWLWFIAFQRVDSSHFLSKGISLMSLVASCGNKTLLVVCSALKGSCIQPCAEGSGMSCWVPLLCVLRLPA